MASCFVLHLSPVFLCMRPYCTIPHAFILIKSTWERVIKGRSDNTLKLCSSQCSAMSLRSGENFQILGAQGDRRLIAGTCRCDWGIMEWVIYELLWTAYATVLFDMNAGYQRSRAICMEQTAGRVDDRYCQGRKPDDIQRTCNQNQCPAVWVAFRNSLWIYARWFMWFERCFLFWTCTALKATR